MTARSIALIAIFAALAIVLNTIRIPTFYWPGWFYTLSDIPVIVAFLIYGFRIGILAEPNTNHRSRDIFPSWTRRFSSLSNGPSCRALMMFGIYLAKKFLVRKSHVASQVSEKKAMIYFTGFGVALRGSMMPIMIFFVLYQVLLPIVLGRVIPTTYVMGLIPRVCHL
jgi:hypothetical protein